jgi:F-type H+-transporting ATPase subunit b
VDTLLNPDIGLAIWTISTFLILLFVLSKFAWKPLIKVLQDREQGIRRSIDDAASAKQSAESLKAQLEADLNSARDKVNVMIAQAQGDAQKIRDQIVREAELQSQRMMEQTRVQMEQEKDKALQDLRKEVTRISLNITEKILRQSPGAMKDQAPMIEGFLKDLDKGSHTKN